MRFRQEFYGAVIREWSSFYIDYDNLRDQIKRIQSSAIDLAQAYSKIQDITGKNVRTVINVEELKESEAFWKSLDENVQKVENNYSELMVQFVDQFKVLTLQAIKLNLIQSYVPFTSGLSSRLEREVERLGIPVYVRSPSQKKKSNRKTELC